MDALIEIFRSKHYSGPPLRFSRAIVGLDGAAEALLFANLLGAQLSNLEFDRCKFSMSTNGGTFRDVSFLRCHFDRIPMRHTLWQRCSFAGSVMVPDMTDAVFEDCNFAGAKLRGIAGQYGGRRTRFVRCDFRDCVFDHVQFLAGRLVDCDVSTLRIIKSDLRGTSHNGTPLQTGDHPQ
jgi:uncharacterized protein YjbI with pentapeptide repeats